MTTLKRHRNVILVGLLAAVGVWWWHKHQSSSGQQDTSPNTAVPYYVSSPVPGSGSGSSEMGSPSTTSTSTLPPAQHAPGGVPVTETTAYTLISANPKTTPGYGLPAHPPPGHPSK